MANYGGGAPAPKYNRKSKGRPVAMRGKRFDSTGTTLAQRTRARLAVLNPSSIRLPGVDTSDGISRKEARTVRLARRQQKAAKRGQRAYNSYKRYQRNGS